MIELTSEDKKFLEKFNQAKVLNLSFTGLRSLKNLPVIETLEKLDLSDNNLNGEDLNQIYLAFKKIKVLLVANNAIKNPDHAAFLNKCSNMKKLDLSANPITEMQYYRENVFEKLGFLRGLDGYDKSDNEWSLQDGDELNKSDDSFENFC